MSKKQEIIRSWKEGLKQDKYMSDDAWYLSFVGLVMRLYWRGLITQKQADTELGNFDI